MENKYNEKVFILKKGELEDYVNKRELTVEIANKDIGRFKNVNDIDEEIKNILEKIIAN